MRINPNRQKISLEETLSFIRYLNKEQPFDREEIVIPTHDIERSSEQKTKAVTLPEKQKKKVETLSDQELNKKINKNRAIKRIIESAFLILQNFDNYEEDKAMESNDKSSEIQFNIYLKQFNRVLQNIYNLQKNKIKSESEKAEMRQEVLQNIYEYTVVEDFRQILPVAILKDKISKNNIQIMIESLSRNLVVLKPGELRIYNSPEQSSSFKSIKLHEIENVDYHTQPHIFIVLAIQKDKERFNVYMQFESQKNQEKWDRALYCCYIGRKMKTKEKFFLIEYPEQDVKKKQKQQTKKQAAFHYQLESAKPLDKIFTNDGSLTEKSREERHDAESSISRSRSGIGRQQMSTLSKQQMQDGSGTPNDKRNNSSMKIIPENRSKKLTQIGSDTNRLLDIDKSKIQMMRHKTTDNVERRPKQPSLTPDSPSNMDITDRAITRTHIFGSARIKEEQFKDSNQQQQEQNEQELAKSEQLPDDIKELHNLERRHVKGLILEKQKFFFNKAKIVFLKEGSNPNEPKQQDILGTKLNVEEQYEAIKYRELEYWDFESSSGEKTERKVIKALSIKSYEIKEDRLLKVVHEKQINFIGKLDFLREIYRWIELVQTASRDRLASKA